MAKLKMNVETITPSIAAQMLKKNNKNRSLRERRVKRLAQVISAGQWQLNGDAIRIAKDGTLLDGQHRLRAVIMSKKPITSVVMRNLPLETMSTMDLGAMRSCGNHLQMAGYKGSVFALAAAISICLSFRKGVYIDHKEKMTPDDMLDFIKSNRAIQKSAELFTHNDQISFRDLLPQSVSISTHHLFTEIDKFKAEAFFSKLISGTELGKTSPILKLRTELIAMRKSGKRGELNRRIFLYYVTTAFQLYLDDKRVDALPPYKEDSKVLIPKIH